MQDSSNQRIRKLYAYLREKLVIRRQTLHDAAQQRRDVWTPHEPVYQETKEITQARYVLDQAYRHARNKLLPYPHDDREPAFELVEELKNALRAIEDKAGAPPVDAEVAHAAASTTEEEDAMSALTSPQRTRPDIADLATKRRYQPYTSTLTVTGDTINHPREQQTSSPEPADSVESEPEGNDDHDKTTIGGFKTVDSSAPRPPTPLTRALRWTWKFILGD